MPALPASVRLALWSTSALAGHCSMSSAVSEALPDLDHVEGALEALTLWADLGEQLVAVALPRPGHVSVLPTSADGLAAAAVEAGECVFVPALGGALVPTIEQFGPAGDTGWGITWQQFGADPVPGHLLAGLDVPEIERGLRAHLADATGELTALDALPWAGSGIRAEADERAALRLWGLPPGIDGRPLRVIQLAGTVAAACEFGLEQTPAVDAGSHGARERVLRDLLGAAETALAQTACVAATAIAGLRHRS
ncbi:hypothetical protein ACMYYO_07900 [Dermacoccaceae bacterium W4C1]